MIKGMNHVTLAVLDINISFTFYTTVLGLQPLVKWDKGAYFVIGDQAKGAGFWFCLNVDEKREPNPCYTHYAFTVSKTDFDAMSAKILASGAHIFKENTSLGESLYFLDPDEHKLEIHVGNYQERIAAKKAHLGEWEEVEWFV
ncbi:VOC family protein [Candidatus Berkiella aquae]|uniref:Glutathione transferase FosA n=1 Tax=Candidatus Berkiella aquae TaxID=295108 RepID=A0A0Q9YPJ5_9GAMM|nr:VOC family protein [Candidatus Berkiella aquae]MCS5711897.1 VOC family protein [Candidatus Berkiella aquae]